MSNQIQFYRDVTTLLLEQDLAALENLDRRLRERYQEGYDEGYRAAKNL